MDLALASNETDIFLPNDGQGFGLWVKQTKLMMVAFGVNEIPLGSDSLPSQAAPASPFPFARFAAINDTSFFLYHQISPSLLAEDIWDFEARIWVSKNITISTWN